MKNKSSGAKFRILKCFLNLDVFEKTNYYENLKKFFPSEKVFKIQKFQYKQLKIKAYSLKNASSLTSCTDPKPKIGQKLRRRALVRTTVLYSFYVSLSLSVICHSLTRKRQLEPIDSQTSEFSFFFLFRSSDILWFSRNFFSSNFYSLIDMISLYLQQYYTQKIIQRRVRQILERKETRVMVSTGDQRHLFSQAESISQREMRDRAARIERDCCARLDSDAGEARNNQPPARGQQNRNETQSNDVGNFGSPSDKITIHIQ